MLQGEKLYLTMGICIGLVLSMAVNQFNDREIVITEPITAHVDFSMDSRLKGLE